MWSENPDAMVNINNSPGPGDPIDPNVADIISYNEYIIIMAEINITI